MLASKKIDQLLNLLNVNAKSFSEALGYERPQIIYDIQKGKTKRISPILADKIVSVFPTVNRAWLLADEGEMLRTTEVAEAADENGDSVGAVSPHLVPLIPDEAFAGPLENLGRESVMMHNCKLVVSPIPGAEFAIQISGDSMEPEIPNGSRVFMRKINDRAFIPWGHTLVIDSENGIYIKKVFPPSQDNPECVEARSANPKYPPMHIPMESIFGLYRVLAVSKLYITM